MADQVTIAALWPSWERSLKAKNRSAATLRNYRVHLEAFAKWLEASGNDTALTAVKRRHIEDYLIDERERTSASTAATRFRCLRVFFNWCIDEDEIEASPMASMVAPTIEEKEVPIFDDDDLRSLLAVCDGKGWAERRDTAIIRLLVDTGLRAAEIMSLTLADVDIDHNTATVMGKGSRGRTVAYGNKTTVALDRYLRSRRSHKHAQHPEFWLGIRGPMGPTGLSQMLKRRGEQAGIADVHPHRFRHTFAHRWLAAGGQEGDLQHLAGWATGDMLRRYGSSAKAERARNAHRKLALGDQL